MRTVTVFAFALLLAAIAALNFAGTTAAVAATPEKTAQCEEQKKACLAAGTQEGSNGVRYVPPDVVKQCYDGYRTCMGQN
jgi:hypothetical protein